MKRDSIISISFKRSEADLLSFVCNKPDKSEYIKGLIKNDLYGNSLENKIEEIIKKLAVHEEKPASESPCSDSLSLDDRCINDIFNME